MGMSHWKGYGFQDIYSGINRVPFNGIAKRTINAIRKK